MIYDASLKEWRAKFLAKRHAPAPFTFIGHFCRYTSPTQKVGMHKSMSLETLFRVPDIIARAERSGCEGCYIEVARWSHLRVRWERFAFEKCFGGEIKEMPDLSDKETCETVAALINTRHRSEHESFIHNLPSFNEPVGWKYEG